ncbi:MAG: sensor histidine kinase, partial [Bradymonadaceae bacterium]
ILLFMSDTAEPLLTEYRLSVLFLLCMAALAIQPIRQHAQEVIGRSIFKGHAHSSELAEALARQEERAHQSERLAELGTFTSAIAHEVRNPLGVISAYLAVLERQDVDEETLTEMRDQISRASQFIDDLLDYGRPRPLELRMIPIEDTIDLAISSATAGLGDLAPNDVVWTRDIDTGSLSLEADQAQLLQVLVILFENALLAIRESDHKEVRVHCELSGAQKVTVLVEDSGPGLATAIAARLFEPFVTSRKRGETRRGTGLGLAIARGIVGRHEGTISTCESSLGGAAFIIELPRHQNVLAAATASDTQSRSHLS